MSPVLFVLQSWMYRLMGNIFSLSFLKPLLSEKVNLDSACDISMSHSAKPPLSWSRRSNIYSICAFTFIITTPEVELNAFTFYRHVMTKSKVILCKLTFYFKQ